MKIPVQNFYYLLCYAWDKLEESKVVDVGRDDYEQLVNLFARVLCSGLEHLLKRGLDQGYREHRQVYPGIRGKIDFAGSLKGHHLPMGRAVCVFEEMTHDVLHNRIIKKTVQNLLRAEELDLKLADKLGACLARMGDVSDIHLAAAAFNSVQLHSNNGFYAFILSLCRLIHEAAVIDVENGRLRFRDFAQDDTAMASLFERFLLNFYKRELAGFKVRSEGLPWANTVGSPADLELLPRMRTDVSLESANKKIIIDAKYYSETAQTHFGKESVRSAHLYQLFAYLRNVAAGGGVDAAAEGILLYPQVDRTLDLRFTVHGHPVRIATVNLATDWRMIHDFLLRLVLPQSASGKSIGPESSPQGSD
jgi:5-methylcytosine-specific restriction enzyme subunit McrC